MKLAWGGALAACALGVWFGGCGVDAELSPNGDGGHTGTTSSTTSSTSNSTSTPTGAEYVGLPCTVDEECGPDGFCLQATATVDALATFWGEANAGGPAGGYCTQSCSDDDDCPGDSSRCMGREPDGFCVLGCSFGWPELEFLDQELPEDKCHGRDDLMCSPVTGGGAVCMPVCGTDNECPTDRYCHPRVGLCVDQAREGDPMGAACVPDDSGTPQDEDTCAGRCRVFEDDQGQPRGSMCTSYCSMGGSLETTQNCGGPQNGLCVFQLTFSDDAGGLGDMGVCSNACLAHDDCNYPESLFCFDLNTLAELGVGFCAGATDCPLGTECQAGEICADTAYGPACIEEDPQSAGEPLFPLGNAAGGAGGAAGGGAGAAGGAGGS